MSSNFINTHTPLISVLRLWLGCLLSLSLPFVTLYSYGTEPAVAVAVLKSSVPEGHADTYLNNGKKTLKIARGDGNYPPLEMFEQGNLTGLHIDIIRHVAQELNVEIEFLSLPWARAVKYFSEGKVDAISYYGYTKKREVFSYYTPGNILSDTRWVLIALEERKHEFVFDQNLKGLEDYIIGVQLGYSHGMHFDNMKHFKRDVVIDDFSLERMLNTRRHDLAMMSYQEFLGFKHRGDFKGITALLPSIDLDPQYLAFSKTMDTEGFRKKLANKFSAEFEKFKLTETYQELLKKYDFDSYQ